MSGLRNKIERNLQAVNENIAAACARRGRSAGEVAIVAVTKSATLEGVKAAVELGLTQLGESRVQHLVERAVELRESFRRASGGSPAIRWHMIGHLQRNKVKLVLEAAEVIHSVDSLRLAEHINLQAERMGKTIDVLLQVNCSNEPQKSGVAVGAAKYLGEMLSTLGNLRLAGLMTMAPLSDDPQQTRPSFIRLRELFEEMRNDGVGGANFRHLSMGMSQDYPAAIEEGATMVRIGTALFG